MGLLSRPEEVAALVRLKVAAGPIWRQIPPKMHSAFAYEMLQRVSCSFALRPELRNARPVPTIHEGVNFDLPDVFAAAPPIAGVKHVGGDMFKSIPSGDAIFIKKLLTVLYDSTH
ncbi:hypothetical protein ZWY2020_053096 [Hordeum vulgare]|nr:hypothetical protein ZWY2020_053096 [Hordeum vulgare]